MLTTSTGTFSGSFRPESQFMGIAQLAADKAALNGRLREMQHATRACQRRCRGLLKTKAKQQRRAATVAFVLFVWSSPDRRACRARLVSHCHLAQKSATASAPSSHTPMQKSWQPFVLAQVHL